LDGAALLLLGTASLSPKTGGHLAASLLVVYWAPILSSSSVVYLKMLFSAQKGGSYRASLTEGSVMAFCHSALGRSGLEVEPPIWHQRAHSSSCAVVMAMISPS
jgi:hypothetical protein